MSDRDRDVPDSSSSRGATWALSAAVALTLVALALRLSAVGRSLWLDEAWRANIALLPSRQAFWDDVLGAGTGIGAPMPPLFALLLRAWALLVGNSSAGLRALPVAASVAAVPLGYIVGRRAFGVAAGLATALLFAFAPAMLLHGQELKQYPIDILVVLVLLLAVSGVAARPERAASWAALGLAAALAPGVSYPSALVLPGIALATLTVCRRQRDLWRWLAAQAMAGLGALAWYGFVIAAQRERPRTLAYWAADFPTLEGTPSLTWVGGQLLDVVAYALGQPAWVLAIAVVAGLAWSRRWLAVVAVVTVATSIAAAALRLYPLAGGRTSLFLVPFLYLAAGGLVGAVLAGAAAARRRGKVPAALGAAAAVAVVVLLLRPLPGGALHPTRGLVREETAPLVAALAAERRPSDRVYVYDGAVPAFRFYHPERDDLILLGGSHRDDAKKYADELRPLLVPGERLWLLFAHVFTPRAGASERDAILRQVSLYGRQVDVREAEGASLHLFETARAPGSVKHVTITPEDMRDPERMKQLLGR